MVTQQLGNHSTLIWLSIKIEIALFSALQSVLMIDLFYDDLIFSISRERYLVLMCVFVFMWLV